MKGITIVLNPSEEGKRKLEKMKENSLRTIERLKREMVEGKYDHIIKDL